LARRPKTNPGRDRPGLAGADDQLLPQRAASKPTASLKVQSTWRYVSLCLAAVLWSKSATGAPAATADSQAAGDDYMVDVWDADRGLPQSTVTSIAQTPDGYLRIGTLLGGLARFDGVRFVTYDPANSPNLSSIEIQQLQVDAQGALWIGLVDGAFITRSNGRFHFERQDPQTPYSLMGKVVASRTNEVILSSIYGWLFYGQFENGTNHWLTLKPPGAHPGSSPVEDRDGVIWYRQKNLRLGRIRGQAVELLNSVPGLQDQRIYALTKDIAGQIWVGTPKELARWDGTHFVDQPLTNGQPLREVRQIAAAPDGGLWIWSENQLRKWRGDQWQTSVDVARLDLLGTQRPVEIHPDIHGGVWLFKYGSGLWHIDANGTIAEIGARQGLPSKLIECWFQDREGNVWLGLNGSGLACVRKRTFHVVWPDDPAVARGAVSVCEDARGQQWFGTSGDNFLRWADGHFDKWSPPPDKLSGVDTTVYPDQQDRLWVGTVQNGVWIFETNTLRRPFPSEAVGTVVRAFYQDRAGRMWIGNEFGLYCWENGQLKTFTARDGFASAHVLALTEDESGTLWLGTANGELRSYKDGKFTSYRPTDGFVISSNRLVATSEQAGTMPSGSLVGAERFWAIYPDRHGVLWIGTLSGGLLRFQDGRFTRYTTQDGLPNDNVSQILEDTRARFWLGTRGGIACVEREDLEKFARGEAPAVPCVTYGQFDGLPSIECSGGYQPDCWAGADGRLWFTTIKGATWINPKKLPFNPLPPPVRIEEFWVDKQLVYESDPGPRLRQEFSGQARPPRQLTSAPLRISSGRHYFEFKFTALSFMSPDKVRFKWRLRGADREWVDGGTDRSVSYSYLPPGNYEFFVQACNNDGVWNERGASL
jgi:ligand-binding sensor domain-containing protein